MRVDSGVAGEGTVVGIPKFHSWHHAINEYQLRLMSNASSGLCIILLYYTILFTSKVTAPQDAHKQ